MSMVSEVQLLLDEAGGPVWWSLQQIYDALNQASIDLHMDCKMTNASADLAITSGADLVAIPTSDIMVPQYVVYNNKRIFSTTQDELENWSRRWHDQPAAQPKWLVLWDWETFRVFPSSDANYTFTLWGLKWPDEIGVSTPSIPVDATLYRAIVLLAVAYLLEFTQPELSLTYMQEVEQFKQRMLTNFRNNLGANITRLRPGVGWSLAQGGDIKLGNRY